MFLAIRSSKVDGRPTPEAQVSPTGSTEFARLVGTLLQLAHAAEREPNAQDELHRFTSDLDPTMVSKVAVIVRAGEDARDISDTLVALRGVSTPAQGIWDVQAWAQYLKRGLAIARATGFDLEPTMLDWAAKGPRSKALEDRVWLRFGRELARSIAADWTCFVDLSGGDVLEKVYLRRGSGPWWSFGAFLDRPSKQEVARLRGQRGKGQRKLALLPTKAVLGRRCGRNRTALKRAVSALNACFGPVTRLE